MEVNNKICTTCSNLYCKSFLNFDSTKSLPQHRQIPLESSGKVSVRSTVEFEVMSNSVKLDGRKVYAKIQI
jgi:hypothetical protein